MIETIQSVLDSLRSGGYAAKAAVTRRIFGGPFVVPREAVIFASRGDSARLRLVNEIAVGNMGAEKLARYVLLSMPWDTQDAEQQFRDFTRGYESAGVEVVYL